jgi:hypothetical protein
VFQAAVEFRDAGRLEPYEEERLERDLGWLRVHLPAPPCLRDEGNRRATCWFKPTARRAIDRVRGIVALLEAHGPTVQMVTTAEPGSVIYVDQWQVVAKPRRRAAAGRTRVHG